MEFENVSVVITGGGSGIGSATTRAFLAAGARVAFTYATSVDEARAIELEYNRNGRRALAIKADATDPAEVERAFAQAQEAFGPVEVLFANAGGLLKRSRLTETPLSLWQEAFAVNVTSAMLACQAALRVMEPRRKGSIILMSSLAALNGGGNGASHYAAAKGAIATLTLSLAKEVGPLGIRVNAVAPGLIATRFHDIFSTPEGRQAGVTRTPLRREGQPEDVADVVLSLASERSRFITGEVVKITGGQELA
ncbi:SDR family NAD(P)-dependent oxidoreductase [Terrarubrum flagellatum]|uniref:SDR family NAD(P)-dependent oxidoreductase n=1 Tax=Terrirubrum flagellatum TaxID=2895980 RepID=UPI003144EC40